MFRNDMNQSGNHNLAYKQTDMDQVCLLLYLQDIGAEFFLDISYSLM